MHHKLKRLPISTDEENSRIIRKKNQELDQLVHENVASREVIVH